MFKAKSFFLLSMFMAACNPLDFREPTVIKFVNQYFDAEVTIDITSYDDVSKKCVTSGKPEFIATYRLESFSVRDIKTIKNHIGDKFCLYVNALSLSENTEFNPFILKITNSDAIITLTLSYDLVDMRLKLKMVSQDVALVK